MEGDPADLDELGHEPLTLRRVREGRQQHRVHRVAVVVAALAHRPVGAVGGARPEDDVEPPVVVAEAGGGGEDVPGREDGADAPGPVHPPVPVQ